MSVGGGGGAFMGRLRRPLEKLRARILRTSQQCPAASQCVKAVGTTRRVWVMGATFVFVVAMTVVCYAFLADNGDSTNIRPLPEGVRTGWERSDPRYPPLGDIRRVIWASADSDHNVIAILSDVNFFSSALAWIQGASRSVSRSNMVGLSVDGHSMRNFEKYGIRSINASEWFKHEFGDDVYHRCDAIKAWFALNALTVGVNVYVTDADAFVLKNPFNALCRDADFEMMADTHNGPYDPDDFGDYIGINAGCWYARCSDRPECHAFPVIRSWLSDLLENPHGFGQGFLVNEVNHHAKKLILSDKTNDKLEKDRCLFIEARSKAVTDPAKQAIVRLSSVQNVCFDGNLFRGTCKLGDVAIVHVARSKRYVMAAIGVYPRQPKGCTQPWHELKQHWPPHCKSDAVDLYHEYYESDYSGRLRGAKKGFLTYDNAGGSWEKQRHALKWALWLALQSDRILVVPFMDCSAYGRLVEWKTGLERTGMTCDPYLWIEMGSLMEAFPHTIRPPGFLRDPKAGLSLTTRAHVVVHSTSIATSIAAGGDECSGFINIMRARVGIEACVVRATAAVIDLSNIRALGPYIVGTPGYKDFEAKFRKGAIPSFHYYGSMWNVYETHFSTPGTEQKDVEKKNKWRDQDIDGEPRCKWRGETYDCKPDPPGIWFGRTK